MGPKESTHFTLKGDNKMKYTEKGGLIWVQGTLGYILMIAFTSLRYPNNEEMILRLADHLFPFFVYGMGFVLIGCLFDISTWILNKIRISISKET